MDYIHLKGHIDISIARSKSESATFNMPRPSTLGLFSTVRVVPINDSICCHTSRFRSCLQLFKLHLNNNHRLSIGVGITAIGIGVIGLVFSLGISSIISWCLISSGVTLIVGALYHSGSVSLNCGLCRTARSVEDSDSEMESSR